MERINATTGSYNFIDLFAGAGGLSEGFIQAGFSPVAHVEMNPYAAQTLETRTGYYYLKAQGKLDIYKDYISGKITRDEFLQHIPEEQLQSVFCETMSNETLPRLFENIDRILTQRGIKQVDVIIGGPPCQAYSLVGRAQSKHTFLDDAEKRTEYYSESDRNKLSGFLFRINLNDKYFWVYQHIYSVSRIDRSKNIIALFVGDTYDEIDSDIVQIDSRADVIIFSSSVVTAKMDLMQRFFGFEQYIRAGAQKTIEIIRDLDIVDSLEKFVAFENKSKLTNAKKLLKAKNSPVLQMKKNDLLENLKKHSRYKTMFKFEEDHIVISSQKEAAAFIKMLNDDIVRSELTGKEYDSSSKMLLGPVGASH